MAAPIDAEWMETFLSFAQTRNLTATARARHLSQPAIHLQIRKLSEHLGVTLYRRKGRRLELTAAGLDVAGFASELRDRTAEFLDRLHSGQSNAPVTLVAGEGSYLYLLGDAIRLFNRRKPHPLRLLTQDRDGTVEAVRTGAAHLGVTTLDVPPDDLSHEILADVPAMLVMPKSHRLARKRRLALADLADERFIVPPAGRALRTVIAQTLQSAGVPWQVAVEASGWELMLHFARLGLGVTIVNGCCRIPKGLVAKPLAELPRSFYFLLARPGTLRLASVSELRKDLLEATSKWR